MNPSSPANDLDRAIRAMGRSQSAMPEFYRALAAGELWFLLPYHPELEEQDICIENGAPLPFAVLTDAQGEVVPLFSSEERAEEALQNGEVPSRTFLTGSLPAKQVLEILGAAGLRAVINQSCAIGNVIVGPDLMRDLANGTALKPLPMGSGRPVTKSFSIINAADYPTDLVQPLFEHLRRHASFRAAWVFGAASDEPSADGLPVYYVLTLMQPRDQKLFHDFNLIAQAARGTKCKVELSLQDETNEAEIARLFQRARPFFVAADYQPPTPTE